MPRLSARLQERSTARLSDYIVDCAWSPDGSALAIALGDGSIHIAGRDDARGSRQLGRHAAGALAVAWFGDGAFCSSGQDSTLRFWNPAGAGSAAQKQARAWTTQLLARPRGAQTRTGESQVGAATVVAAATGRSITLWAADGSAVAELGEQSGVVQGLAFTPDGATLAAVCTGTLSLFRLDAVAASNTTIATATGIAAASATTTAAPAVTTVPVAAPSAVRVPWEGASLCLAMSPNGRYVASGLRDGAIRFRRLAAQENSQISGYDSKVALIAWTANSRYLASAMAEQLIVWDFSGRGPEGREPLRLRHHTDDITALAAHPTRALIASGGRDWRVVLCEPGAGTVPLDVQLAQAEPSILRWSADGTRLAVGQTSGDLTLYELVNG